MLWSFAFVNSWRPEWMPTTPGWAVVPGGWSIGVEFTFYWIFPALAAFVVSLPRAAILLTGTLLIAAVSNYFGTIWLSDYNKVAADNFLYFWFPNQAPVFSLGFILYFLVTRPGLQIASKKTAYGVLAATLVAWLIAAEHPVQSQLIGLSVSVPNILIATSIFMVFIFVLARGPETLFTHKYIRRMGVLSFSAYVLHFLFVHKIPVWTGGLINCKATGYTAIATGAALWVLTMIGTVAASAVAHKLIEQPAINWAHRLTSTRPRPFVTPCQLAIRQ